MIQKPKTHTLPHSGIRDYGSLLPHPFTSSTSTTASGAATTSLTSVASNSNTGSVLL